MNFYFLAAGILLVFLSVAHAVWGQIKLFIKESENKVANQIAWHQITILLFISGLTSFYCSINPDFIYLMYLVFLILLANFAVFIFFSIRNKEILKQSVPQIALFLILYILIILGF